MAKIYSKDPDVVFRKIAEECILVPVKRNVGDLENIFTMNEVAAHIWEQIDGEKSIEALADSVSREFDVTTRTAEDDVLKFLDLLHKAELIKEV